MVVDILGVVNEVPVAKLVPPVEAAYQLIVPALALAPNITVPVPQREAGIVEETDGMVLTVRVTAADVSLQPDALETINLYTPLVVSFIETLVAPATGLPLFNH